ncbi:MAG: ABC transporter ATP-binding protein [Desulfuromonadales bacterium]
MSSEPAISIQGLGKCYHIYDKPRDRLLQMLFRGRRTYYREFWALQDVSFEVARGETVGIVGRNGAGKSTLLQIICNTLNPSLGDVRVNGRVAALLELGAGFNPEFTGRENVYLNASILGLATREIDARYDEIVAFSGIGDFIHQPVKTYSSGMYVRLAFAVATSVEPDILVVDEALSVGDGGFARKSFDRILELKKRGTTILFCSHSLYQVEAFCDRALWLDKGLVCAKGAAADVTTAYAASLSQEAAAPQVELVDESIDRQAVPPGTARITSIHIDVDGISGKTLTVRSQKSDLTIRVGFASDPTLPTPTVGVSISLMDGRGVSGASTLHDGLLLERDDNGNGIAEIVYPALPLLKGDYTLSVVLGCESMIHPYDTAMNYATLKVEQTGLDQGIVMLPHIWKKLSVK